MKIYADKAAALKYSQGNIKNYASRLIPLRDKIIDGLSQIDGAHLNGDPGLRLPNNVSFCFDGIEGEAMLLLLDRAGVCVSSGSACSAGSLEPSHVLLALGRSPALAGASLRITIGEDITEAEADYIVSAVKDALIKLRSLA